MGKDQPGAGGPSIRARLLAAGYDALAALGGEVRLPIRVRVETADRSLRYTVESQEGALPPPAPDSPPANPPA